MLPVTTKPIGVCVQCPIFFSILKEFGFPRQIFVKVPTIKFHGNLTIENRADTCGRRMDMPKVIVAFKVMRERLHIHGLA
jgi:hypothetical protein